jgi:putative MATE family efflux protein
MPASEALHDTRAWDREILRLAVPAFGALIAEPIYVLTDTAIVGHLGTTELGALSAASAVLLTSYSICIFLAYGTTAAVARLLGAGEHRRAAHEAVQGVWLALLLGVALALIGLVAGRQALRLFGDDPAVQAGAWVYLRASLPGIPAALVMLAGVGYLRGLQQTRRPLEVAIATASLNLVLEVVWVYGFDGGLQASALATVAAQWVGAAVYLRWIARAVAQHGVSLFPDPPTIRALGRVGVHLFVRTLALRGAFVLTTIAAAHLGTVELAAHEVAFQIMMLLALALDSVAIAGQAIVGRLLGAGDAHGSYRASLRMIRWATLLGAGMCAVLLVVRGPVAGLFTDDATVEALTAFVLVHVAVLQPVNGALFALDGILIGAGDQRYLAFTMPVATTVLAVLVAVFWQTGAGIGWLWFAVMCFMVMRLGALVRRFRTDAWRVVGVGR